MRLSAGGVCRTSTSACTGTVSLVVAYRTGRAYRVRILVRSTRMRYCAGTCNLRTGIDILYSTYCEDTNYLYHTGTVLILYIYRWSTQYVGVCITWQSAVASVYTNIGVLVCLTA